MFKVINESVTTIMLVTHDVKVASKTERVLFMIDGKIEGEYNLGKFKKENNDSTQREEKRIHFKSNGKLEKYNHTILRITASVANIDR